MPFLLLMPSYNQAHYIKEAVDSVLAQDDPDWELWILDNSTDGTPQVMAAYSDPRIHFIHEPRRMDPGLCLNEMLRMATGEFFSYIHTDNRLGPNYVSAFRTALRQHPMALAYCDQYDIDEDVRGRKYRKRPPVFSSARLFSWDSLGAPFAATTKLAEAVGGFSADDLADDVYFALKSDGLGPRIHVPKALVEYRSHGGSRAESLGYHAVAQAIYRSVLKVYGTRAAHLPDPFEGMLPAIQRHAERAFAQARCLAGALLARTPREAPLWIDDVGPASFWLALACESLGRPPKGFRAAKPGTLMGLPVRSLAEPLELGAHCLRPRRKGLDSSSLGQDWTQPFRWLLRGLPPTDHALKRYPASIMCSLLVPFHHQHPGGAVCIQGQGPLGAYLAYGLETIAQLPVLGFSSGPGVLGLPQADGEGEGTLWSLPGAPFAARGIAWRMRASHDPQVTSPAEQP
ncbi:glycosyltransferase [Geothrix sp. PMB-07]|uniref:glycosyltransferase family 2 protein n=1 Tax=Geothrix sp. PMB-07 TaxID=3068640 RepID=UPI002741FA12|nr:glycosyltransferase [Geothrix sp. PMB-07]WLT33240.1 glycosyltransferase [Geothrix sp. PMB-07]